MLKFGEWKTVVLAKNKQISLGKELYRSYVKILFEPNQRACIKKQERDINTKTANCRLKARKHGTKNQLIATQST